MKIQKKKMVGGSGWGGGGGQVRGGGGQDGCEWRSEAFVKIKIKYFLGVWKVGSGGVGLGGRVWVDGNGEVKLLCKFKKKWGWGSG